MSFPSLSPFEFEPDENSSEKIPSRKECCPSLSVENLLPFRLPPRGPCPSLSANNSLPPPKKGEFSIIEAINIQTTNKLSTPSSSFLLYRIPPFRQSVHLYI